jgi:hypothetical protein
MPQNTLYARVVALEDEESAPEMRQQFDEFIQSRTWKCRGVRTLGESSAAEATEQVGMALDLPDRHEEPRDWFADVAATLAFCATLRRQFDCDFLIALRDNRSRCTEELLEIDSDVPDVDYIRKYLGVRD